MTWNSTLLRQTHLLVYSQSSLGNSATALTYFHLEGAERSRVTSGKGLQESSLPPKMIAAPVMMQPVRGAKDGILASFHRSSWSLSTSFTFSKGEPIDDLARLCCTEALTSCVQCAATSARPMDWNPALHSTLCKSWTVNALSISRRSLSRLQSRKRVHVQL